MFFMDQKLLEEAIELESYGSALEQHEQFLSNQIEELKKFSDSANSLFSSKENKILAAVGKGVYIPAQITSDKIFVEVGAGVVVKKTYSELQEVIKEQLAKLIESQRSIEMQLQLITQQLQKTMAELEKSE